MVTIDDLKQDLHITYNADNDILQRNLDAAIAIVEKYTSLSMVEKAVPYRAVVGHKFKVYQSPIESVTGGTYIECDTYAVITPTATTVTVNYGAVDYPNLNKAVLRIAGDMYENVEISEVTLPIDVQLLLNQYRNDSFLS